jgi:hypothetical protein
MDQRFPMMVSSLTAFEMSGLECLTKYNNIPTPQRHLVLSVHHLLITTVLGGTRSLEILVGMDVLRKGIVKIFKSFG